MPKAPKFEQRVARAKDLIAHNPLLGKDAINKLLRQEYGVGLRRIEVAKLKRQTIIPETAREVQQQLNRRHHLRKEGFIDEEVIFYSQYPVSTSGMTRLRTFRQTEIRQAQRAGIPSKRIPAYIYESYRARGFLTKQGLDVNGWTQQVIAQLEKKPRQRKTVAIQADRFKDYLKAIAAKIAPPEALAFTEKIPSNQWAERTAAYNYLIQHHFSNWEAYKIVTAMSPKDKDGHQYLQELDLNNPYWQLHIQDRVKWYNMMLADFMNKGMSRGSAHNAVMRELEIYYAKDKKRKPWDWLKDFSPTKGKGARKEVDYIASAKKREERLRAKKMPYRALSRSR